MIDLKKKKLDINKGIPKKLISYNPVNKEFIFNDEVVEVEFSLNNIFLFEKLGTM